MQLNGQTSILTCPVSSKPVARQCGDHSFKSPGTLTRNRDLSVPYVRKRSHSTASQGTLCSEWTRPEYGTHEDHLKHKASNNKIHNSTQPFTVYMIYMSVPIRLSRAQLTMLRMSTWLSILSMPLSDVCRLSLYGGPAFHNQTHVYITGATG
jgi:hypothetical protein